MLTQLGMPQGAEWLIILGIVVLLFGSAKLPTLVKQLGRSKKIWEEEIGTGSDRSDAASPARPVAAQPHHGSVAPSTDPDGRQ